MIFLYICLIQSKMTSKSASSCACIGSPLIVIAACISERQRELNVLGHVRSHVYTSVFCETVSAPCVDHAWARNTPRAANKCQYSTSIALNRNQSDLQGLVEEVLVTFANTSIPGPLSHNTLISEPRKYPVQVLRYGFIAPVI